MSVIQELFENYDHVPVEFRRHLYMIRELDEQNNKLISERETLKKEIIRKNILDDEEQRTRLLERIQHIYGRIDSMSEEKMELVEKLFMMQENFIRRLDQQIEKTEEDKHVQEKCNQDLQSDDVEISGPMAKMSLKKKANQKAGYGGYGKGGEIPTSYGQSFDQSLMLGQKKSKNEIFGQKMDSSFGTLGSKKRDRARDKKSSLIGGSSSFDSGPQSSFIMGTTNSRRGGIQSQFAFSQDGGMLEEFERGEEDEDQCYMCNLKKPNENWIQCDQCDKWFHYGCVGITSDNVPHENEKYYCPNCKRIQNCQLKANRGYSEFGTNILDDG